MTSELNKLHAMSDLAGDVNGTRSRMPVLFAAHGSPMNAIEDNAFTRHLKAWGAGLPRPVAILVVSAHWLTPGATLVDVQERPHTIHDFGGFPPALHAVQYPAPGAPELARELAAMSGKPEIRPSSDWGLDHGTWSVLRHMFPAADVPVFQLSIDFAQGPEYHYAVGKELNALRDKGVLVMGSGNITHNLRAWDMRAGEAPQASASWAQAFDDEAKLALEQRDDKRLMDMIVLDSARIAHPTPDHYFPLLYMLGAADAGEAGRTVYEGFQGGTFSMRCIAFDA